MTITAGADKPTDKSGPALTPPATSSVMHRSLHSALPLLTHASGSYLYAGTRRILDASGGAAVVSVGHGVPEIVSAVSAQVGTLAYASSALFGIAPAEELAARMCADSGMARALFLTGGSEAVESAIKLCRQYHVERGEAARTKFIAREISYHGNTLGALSLGRHNRRRKHFLPLLNTEFHAVSPANAYRFKRVGESDEAYVIRLADELDAKIRELGSETVAAFFCEPIVGAAAGCVPFPPGYLRAMKSVCLSHGVLFCLDEIMCGFGRSGKLHAWEWDSVQADGEDARPDVQTLGKGLCGGYAPLSAVLVGQRVADGLAAGSGAFVNGFTFQSSGTGVAAGLAVYDYIVKHDLVEQCRLRGELLATLLRAEVLTHPNVGEVRGMGLFWGIELVQDKDSKRPFPAEDEYAERVAGALLARNVAVYYGVGCADGWDGDHIMLHPPYTVTEEEVRVIVRELRAALDEVFVN